jgi:hypothetical protein
VRPSAPPAEAHYEHCSIPGLGYVACCFRVEVSGFRVQGSGFISTVTPSNGGSLFLRDVPLSTLVSAGSTLYSMAACAAMSRVLVSDPPWRGANLEQTLAVVGELSERLGRED